MTNKGNLYRVRVKKMMRVEAYDKKTRPKANGFLDLNTFMAIPAMPRGKIKLKVISKKESGM